MLTAASPSSLSTALTAILDALVDAVFKGYASRGEFNQLCQIFDRTNTAVYLADTERLSGEFNALDTSGRSNSQMELIVLAKILVSTADVLSS
ncbi:hypothetical protein HDU89_008282 [Geranomyces variabilis]|nr:hypothetical protein HDU89_008282 [Geranomyces variabilis]